MDKIEIVDYTFAFAEFLEAHPEETTHKHSAVYVFMHEGQPVQTIIRSLN